VLDIEVIKEMHFSCSINKIITCFSVLWLRRVFQSLILHLFAYGSDRTSSHSLVPQFRHYTRNPMPIAVLFTKNLKGKEGWKYPTFSRLGCSGALGW